MRWTRPKKKQSLCQLNWIIRVLFSPVVFMTGRKKGKRESWLAKRPEAEKRGQNTLESLAGMSGIQSTAQNSCPLPLVVGSRTFLGQRTGATLLWCRNCQENIDFQTSLNHRTPAAVTEDASRPRETKNSPLKRRPFALLIMDNTPLISP